MLFPFSVNALETGIGKHLHLLLFLLVVLCAHCRLFVPATVVSPTDYTPLPLPTTGSEAKDGSFTLVAFNAAAILLNHCPPSPAFRSARLSYSPALSKPFPLTPQHFFPSSELLMPSLVSQT